MTPLEPILLTIAEAAAWLRVSESRVRQATQLGEITAIRESGRILMTPDAVREFVARRTTDDTVADEHRGWRRA